MKKLTLGLMAGFRGARVAAAALALVAGATALCVDADAARTNPRMSDVKLIKVPLTRQATDYTCGAAATQSVIGYYGDNVREAALATQLKTNSKIGTAYRNIEAYAKRHGYECKVYKNSTLPALEKMVDSGTPVMCLIQAWPERKVDFGKDWDDGHWVVAVGHDANNMYFMDPCTLGKYTFIPRDEFLRRWHDTDGKEKLTHFAMTLVKRSAKTTHDPDEIVPME
jgi:predicted double-glycine peptidase